MAQAKPTIDPMTDAPKTKSQVTKPFMIAYMKQKASKEDVEWFKGVVSNPENQKEYINHLTGKPYTDIDIPKVRKEFIERFYPDIFNKKKTGDNGPFIDTILAL